MEPGDDGEQVQGHQRPETERHAQAIKKYLENSDSRFIPEVILSVRCPINLVTAHGEITPDEAGFGDVVLGVTSLGVGPIEISRRRADPTNRMQRVRIPRASLGQIHAERLIRRIDGNHRLHLADELVEDTNFPNKYLAPFCLLLLGEADNQDDDYTESLIFYTINSTALPLESEHGLQLLLGQDPAHAMTASYEFAYNPELHLTRLLKTKLSAMPKAIRAKFGKRPLTSLWDSARSLIGMNPDIAADRDTLTRFADTLFGALSQIVVRLDDDNPALCRSYAFFELAARVWSQSEDEYDEARLRAAVDVLDRMGRWLGPDAAQTLAQYISPAAQLLETFNAAQARIPKRVFLARWYPAPDAPERSRSDLRLDQLRKTLREVEARYGLKLELIDLGTEEGGSFPIHARMYEAIATSDIIICDLTGHRPNVYIEAGFALKHHEQNKLVLLFEPKDADDKVPFDLNTFKYVQIAQAAEIPARLGKELGAILEGSGATVR
jgi:hypothetical protein